MYHVFCPDIAEPTRQDFAMASGSEILLPIDWVDSLDVSNAVLFLASEEARFITGVALPVDGGTLIR